MLNMEVYREGVRQFNELFKKRRWEFLSDRDYEELMERMADAAISDDNAGIQSDELGYFIVAETISIEAANEYLEFRKAV